MASEGGGKIRPKKNQTPSKPYVRNTSLFGKLKSSVKDLLIPSWLSSFSASKDDDTVVGSSQAKPQIETIDLSCPENNVSIDRLGWTNPGLHNRSQQGSFGNSYVDMMPPKQMPAFSSVANGEVHQGVTSNATIVAPNVTLGSTYMHSLPVKNKKSDSPFMNFPERFSHKTVSNVERDDYNKRRRLSSSLTNDYEEDNGQNTSVSSVMVSTGRIEQSLITSSDGDKQKSREPLRQGRPLIPPTRGKPVFNSLLFGTPSKSDQPSFHENFGESLFYSGKTQYGGSSSARRKQLNKSLPYQSSLPLRKQVRATKPKDTLNATTSTTAQRILDTLDRMSGSLETSRNDFGNDSTLSFTPSSYRSIFETSRRSITRPLQLPNRTPPTAQLMSTSQAELAYNRNRPMVRASEGTDSSLAVTQEPIIVVEQDEEEIRSTAAPPKASGKMKTKKFSQHLSGRENADVEIPAYPVLRTDFKLPVSSVNPISLAAFNPIPITTSSHALKSTDKSTPKFTFSTPKSIDKKSHLSSGPAKSSMDEDFTFSSPLQASAAKAAGAEDGSKHSLEPAIGASPGISQGASPSFGASSVRVWESSITPKPKAMSPGFGGASSSFKSCTKWSGSQKNESSAASNSSPFGGIPVASSLKEGSVMDILGGKSSFGSSSKNNGTAKLSQLPASSTDKNKGGNVNSDSAFVPLSALFKKPAGAWDCQACYVQNASEALKCVACETSKAASEVPKVETSPKSSNVPSSELFKKPPGSWDCDACLVRNDLNVNKSVASETLMPGQKSASAVPKVDSSNKSDNVPLSELFKKPPGSWDCDVCMVRNNSNVIKCVACETPKPGQKPATAGTSVSNSKTSPAPVSNFNSTGLSAMFKQPEGTWTCDTCMVQNPPALDKCPCCETPKPGAKKNAPAVAPQKIDKPLSEMFKNPSGSWDCDTCLVNNNATALSCIACESPKPGLQSAGSESKAPSSSGHIDIQPGGGFTFGNLLPTTATTSGSGGFKFGGFGSSNAASSSQDSSSSLGSVPSIPGGFKFGAPLPSNEPASSTVSFGMPATKIVPESISGGFKFGSESNKVKNSNGPEGFNNNTQSKKESSIITGFVPPQQESTVPPSSDAFKFGSSTQQKTSVPSSELFKFGGGSLQATSTSTSVSSNQTFAKSNLTFGASTTSSDSSTTKASGSPFVFGTPISTQNSFGLGTFGSAPASSPIVNGVPGSSIEKSTSSSSGHVGFGVDMEAPKAKMAFTNPESATNGGFSFNAPTSGFGAKAATPAGGFNFAANPSTTPASAFQFSAGTGMTAQPSQSSSSNGFSFTAPSKSINPTDNGNNNNGNANFNPAQSFNFGNDNAKNVFMFGGQSAAAPSAPVFQFGGNPSNPVVPQLNASAGAFEVPSAPSFNMGSGNTTQRKMKKAVRRIKK